MTYTYLVGGIEDTDSRMLTRAVPFGTGASVRRTSLTLPSRHGTLNPGLVIFQESKIALEWELATPNWSSLDVERNALIGLLTAPGDLTVTRRVLTLDQIASCRLEAISTTESTSASPLAALTATLAIPGAFWRAAAQTSATVPAGATGTTTTEIASLAGSTAPIPDATIRVTGPAAQIAVTDLATQTGLSWSGTLTAGTYLYLDASTLRAWLSPSATAWTPSGTDVSGGLDYPAPGPLQLWPRPQPGTATDRRIAISITGTGRTAGTAVAINARPAYL